MSNVLVFLQQDAGKIAKASLTALSAAQQLKDKASLGDLIGVCLGAGASQAADQALQFGFSKVYFSESAEFEKYLAAPYRSALIRACEQGACQVVVASATSTGKDLLPRVAATLDAGQASDIIAVNDDGSLRRPMYAGDVFADVEIVTEKKIVTVRASAFSAATESGSGGAKEELQVESFDENAGEVIGYEMSGSDRPELGDAEIVVSGGRALQSAENFEKYIYPLADVLGAAVGASRAAVDSGYAPNDWQVGQTGKIVAPNLYIAVGISGAIQHLAGMKDSKVIVAINKDPDAPIYDIADYGLVADLFETLPELTEAVKTVKSS